MSRRHPPHPHMPIPQPDYRIHEMNKRLQQRTEESDNLWWDAFATEFFEDEANLTLTFCLDDGPKRYSIGRTLIPRYFRSIFEGGVTELRYELRHPKESFHNASITMDCDQTTVVTLHGKPMYTKVYTEGRLIVEFTFDDMMRIKSWHFAVRTHRELIPRSMVASAAAASPGGGGGGNGSNSSSAGNGSGGGNTPNPQQPPDSAMLESLSKNITRQGLTSTTLNYLRVRHTYMQSTSVGPGKNGLNKQWFYYLHVVKSCMVGKFVTQMQQVAGKPVLQ